MNKNCDGIVVSSKGG